MTISNNDDTAFDIEPKTLEPVNVEAGPPAFILDSDKVVAVRFTPAKPGYDFRQVEIFVDQVAQTLAFLESQILQQKQNLYTQQNEIYDFQENIATLKTTLNVFIANGDPIVGTNGNFVTESQVAESATVAALNSEIAALRFDLAEAQKDAELGWEAEAALKKHVDETLLPWIEEQVRAQAAAAEAFAAQTIATHAYEEAMTDAAINAIPSTVQPVQEAQQVETVVAPVAEHIVSAASQSSPTPDAVLETVDAASAATIETGETFLVEPKTPSLELTPVPVPALPEPVTAEALIETPVPHVEETTTQADNDAAYSEKIRQALTAYEEKLDSAANVTTQALQTETPEQQAPATNSSEVDSDVYDDPFGDFDVEQREMPATSPVAPVRTLEESPNETPQAQKAEPVTRVEETETPAQVTDIADTVSPAVVTTEAQVVHPAPVVEAVNQNVEGTVTSVVTEEPILDDAVFETALPEATNNGNNDVDPELSVPVTPSAINHASVASEPVVTQEPVRVNAALSDIVENASPFGNTAALAEDFDVMDPPDTTPSLAVPTPAPTSPVAPVTLELPETVIPLRAASRRNLLASSPEAEMAGSLANLDPRETETPIMRAAGTPLPTLLATAPELQGTFSSTNNEDD